MAGPYALTGSARQTKAPLLRHASWQRCFTGALDTSWRTAGCRDEVGTRWPGGGCPVSPSAVAPCGAGAGAAIYGDSTEGQLTSYQPRHFVSNPAEIKKPYIS